MTVIVTVVVALVVTVVVIVVVSVAMSVVVTVVSSHTKHGQHTAGGWSTISHQPYNLSVGGARKVDVRLPGKGNSNSRSTKIFSMIKWIRTVG